MVPILILVMVLFSIMALILIHDLIDAAKETARDNRKAQVLDTGMSYQESARIVRRLLKQQPRKRAYQWKRAA